MTKEEREHLWQTTFIACKRHPERRCNRSRFVRLGGKECSSCTSTSPAAKSRLAARWDSSFIPCIKHPNRRCNRSVFIRLRKQKCSYCLNHYPDGTARPAYKRRSYASAMRYSYDRGMKTREHFGVHPRSLQGLELIKRITGYDYRQD